ncbi:MAG: bifunctional pyr operon transcriptional regulator/uracil phosphoribosyltransferase PyrR [Armatimonadetes bacterium]|nr:bifunctional pyr operon transcriptional regulator/uracil phosphoribosyltransferase PyrR [Armatimonadota bacterium]
MPELVLDASQMKRTLGRMAHEVLEANGGSEDLVVVGVLKRGWPLAKRLAFLMTQVEGATIPCGKLDITRFRDDKREAEGDDSSEIPFEIANKKVLLVDEVIFTGRTIRAAMEALLKYGRPKNIQLAVLVDRGFREYPIQPDYCGCEVESKREDHINVRFQEYDGEDGVVLEAAPTQE